MFKQFAQFIRDISGNRSRDDWKGMCLSNVDALRAWFADNGEVSALIGFAVGILLVLMFEFLVVLLVIVALAGYLVWYLSNPSADLTKKAVGELKNEIKKEKSKSSDKVD